MGRCCSRRGPPGAQPQAANVWLRTQLFLSQPTWRNGCCAKALRMAPHWPLAVDQDRQIAPSLACSRQPAQPLNASMVSSLHTTPPNATSAPFLTGTKKFLSAPLDPALNARSALLAQTETSCRSSGSTRTNQLVAEFCVVRISRFQPSAALFRRELPRLSSSSNRRPADFSPRCSASISSVNRKNER